jgi:signal transduction histidine kinase
VFLIVVVTSVVTICTLYVALQYLSLNRFLALEDLQAKDTAMAVRAELGEEVEKLDRSNIDLSVYDDTYFNMPEPSKKYLDAVLGDDQVDWLEQMNVNFLLFVDASGEIVSASGYDSTTRARSEVPEDLRARASQKGTLLQFHGLKDRVAGLIVLSDGPALVASRPIVQTNFEGPTRGALVTVRHLDAQQWQQLARRNGAWSVVAFRMDKDVPAAVGKIRAELSEEEPAYIHAVDEKRIDSYVLFDDIYGKPALMLQVEMPRAIYRQGRLSQLYLGCATILIVAATALLMAWMLQKSVVSRVEKLSSSVADIATSSDSGARVSLPGEDEIASLGARINVMLESLEVSQERRRQNDEQHRAELEKARDAAEAGSRAKSQFLANMSHEIRTPMNGVLGMMELVLESALGDQERGLVSMAKSSAESLLALLNGILDFSKIEAGKLDLEIVPFGLRSNVERAVEGLRLQALRKGLKIESCVEPEVPDNLRGDPTRLRQILVNLIGNAVKFTSKGKVVVSVRCESKGSESVTLEFKVRDTGIGIPKAAHSEIFEAFTQADASTTREFGGSGLGLAICKRLVALMDGNIRVVSEPGLGSTFHFCLPYGFREDLGTVTKVAEIMPSQEIGGALHILLAEDNAVNQLLVVRMLQKKAIACRWWKMGYRRSKP